MALGELNLLLSDSPGLIGPKVTVDYSDLGTTVVGWALPVVDCLLGVPEAPTVTSITNCIVVYRVMATSRLK